MSTDRIALQRTLTWPHAWLPALGLALTVMSLGVQAREGEQRGDRRDQAEKPQREQPQPKHPPVVQVQPGPRVQPAPQVQHAPPVRPGNHAEHGVHAQHGPNQPPQPAFHAPHAPRVQPAPQVVVPPPVQTVQHRHEPSRDTRFGAPRQVTLHRYHDTLHGHNRYYHPPGYVVRTAPSHAHWVHWSGTRYRFWDGGWYSYGPSGYVAVHAPIGALVPVLPRYFTVVTVAGLAYWYANGVYYREYPGGGYEVVPTPQEPPPVQPVASSSTNLNAVGERQYVYPRMNQSPDQQATDEYECHRWAVGQTGFDPTGAAMGLPGASVNGRAEYPRARAACLEGRGYTVR